MTQDINNRAKPGYRQAAEELLVRKNHQTSKEKVHPPNRTNVNRQAKDSKNKNKKTSTGTRIRSYSNPPQSSSTFNVRSDRLLRIPRKA